MRLKVSSLIILVCIGTIAYAQYNMQSTLSFLQSQKAYTHFKAAYQIPADSMAKWNLQDRINFDYLDKLNPTWVGYDSIDYDDIPLPNGHFVWLKAVAEKLQAWLDVRTKLSFNNIANGDKRVLTVFDLNGNVPEKMEASLDGQKLTWSVSSAGFILPRRKKDMDDKLLIIHTPTDTLISWLSYEEPYSYYNKKKAFRSWPVVKQLVNAGNRIGRFFSDKEGYYSTSQAQRQKYQGFIIFNKPLYKPIDTLKFKAWVTDRKGHPVKAPQQAVISYYYKKSVRTISLGTLYPTVPGSYHLSWQLPDSLPMDVQYDLTLKGPKKYNLLKSRFKTEEYQLPDISSFAVATAQNWWLRKDSLVITMEAKDASGIYLPDGIVDLFLTREKLEHFYEDSLFIPDTVWRKKVTLQTEGPTKTVIPANALPEANMATLLFAQLRNSSNELKEQRLALNHYARHEQIVFQRQKDTLRILYEVDGVATSAKAQIEGSGDMYSLDTVVQLPIHLRIHPLADDYDVTALDALGRPKKTASYQLDEPPLTPAIFNTSKADTLSFEVSNPSGMPMWLAITKNKGRTQRFLLRGDQYQWKQQGRKGDRILVQANYWQNEIEKKLTTVIQLQYNLLQVQPGIATTAQPGAHDTLMVKVTDYKGNAVANANLTAVANNTQLQQHFHYPGLPVRIRQKPNKPLKQPGQFDNAEVSLGVDTIAIRFFNILQQLHGDTMFYYQRLADTSPIRIIRSQLPVSMPEASVYVIEQGKPIAIYATYINNLPVNVWWRNAEQANSTSAYPGYSKIGIRTWNKLIEIDSVYLQPYQKHDVFIQTDSLSKFRHAKITPMPDTLSNQEKSILQRHFIQIENDKNTAGAWLWNNSLQARLNASQDIFITGPFVGLDSITLHNSSNGVHAKFPFEPNYKYRISTNLTRLEKSPLLPGKTMLANKTMRWRLGDTAWNFKLPIEQIIIPDKRRIFKSTLLPEYVTDRKHGSLQLQLTTDSTIRFTILSKAGAYDKPLVYAGRPSTIHQLDPGYYQLILVDKHDLAYNTAPFYVEKGGVNAYWFKPDLFTSTNKLAYEIYAAQIQRESEKWRQEVTPKKESIPQTEEIIPGNFTISGRVTDAVTGTPLVGVTVMIKNTQMGATTGADGMYYLKNLASATYTLQFQHAGYSPLERRILAKLYSDNTADVSLKISNESLDEVIVTGYATQRKKDMSGSVTVIENSIQGKAAGVVVSAAGSPGADLSINIRGSATLNGDTSPLYVVDGILMDQLPSNIDQNLVTMEILKGTVATSIYGSRGANGVVIVTTSGNKAPSIRSRFSDDAYFVPNATTNKDGIAHIPITYPDNITGWQHVVYAAAPNGKYGSAGIVTKTFKLLQGLLQVPAFLTEGDSVQVSGKALNYSQQTKTIQSKFTMAGKNAVNSVTVADGQSAISHMGIKAGAAFDTIKIQFSVTDSLQHSDGEERSIPVLPAGTLDTKGSFFVLDGDTTFSYTPAYNDVPLRVYAENNLLNLLERELESLRNYPQACMEQTANKMWGLIMMKQIYQKLGKAFKYDKQVFQLQTRLLENQQYGGGWGWWEKTGPNLYITAKVLQALRHADTTTTIRQAIREGYIYIQNLLPELDQLAKLEALYTLSEGRHVYPYQFALDTIPFDSLHIHAQWQYVRIKQNIGLPYAKELAKLWKKRQQTYTGSIYWGESSLKWYRNIQSTMVIAARTIASDSIYRQYYPQVKQYFLSEKKSAYYGNTVEQAEIVQLLLSDALARQFQSNTRTTLSLNDQQFTAFPAGGMLPGSKAIRIHKEGPGLVYLGLAQQKHVVPSEPKDSLFSIKTQLLNKQGDVITTKEVRTGETIILQATIQTMKEAEFVQVDIPIPAGCSYHTKPVGNWDEFREYRKDKMTVFIERLPAGIHQYKVELDTRFSGVFRLNPARVSLMYFPVFEGYNTLQNIMIKNE